MLLSLISVQFDSQNVAGIIVVIVVLLAGCSIVVANIAPAVDS